MDVLIIPSMQGEVCGLCGPYNGNEQDDWTVGPATQCAYENAPAPGSVVRSLCSLQNYC